MSYTGLPVATRAEYFPYVYRGIIKINEDPENLGRCKIHIPGIYGKYDYDPDLLPWARPITMGRVQIPQKDTIAYVVFEGGQKQSPLYMVGNISTKNPILDPNRITLFESENCSIYYDKEEQQLTLCVGDNAILIGEDGVDISSFSGEVSGGGNIYFDVIEVIDL